MSKTELDGLKKIEISSILKTTAYLDPKKFEEYLKNNVYLLAIYNYQ